MKKMVALLLMGCLLMGLVACGNSQSDSGEEKEAAVSDAAEEEETAEESESTGEYEFTIGMSWNWLDETTSKVHDYFEAACEEMNIEVMMSNAASSIDQQITDIENFITSDVDVIVVSAIDSNAVADVVDTARDAGILVVDYVSGVATEVDVHYGPEFYTMSSLEAQYLVDYLTANPDENLKIGYLWGSKTQSLCNTLYEAFNDTMTGSDVVDRYEVLVEGVTDWKADEAITLTEDWMTAYPDINCYVCQNDQSACGVAEAIRAAGLDPADYLIIGLDGGPEMVDSIADGGVTAAVYRSTQLTGEYMAEVCRDLYNGDITGPDYQALITQFEYITAENVADYQ